MKYTNDKTKTGSIELDKKLEEVEKLICPEFSRQIQLKWNALTVMANIEEMQLN